MARRNRTGIMARSGTWLAPVNSRPLFPTLVLLASPVAHGEAQVTECSVCAELHLTSDYRRFGPSSSAGEPAIQGSLYLQHAEGWYAGVFASTVDFDDGSTRFEFDTYAGVAVLVGTTEYNAELTYVSYDEDVPGPTYDFWQGKLLARQYFGDSWLAASVAYTPRGAFAGGRQAEYLLEGEHALSGSLRLTGGVGYGAHADLTDLRYWSVGIEKDWRALTFALNWAGTDLDESECGGTDHCAPAVVGAITLRLH
jgi:uncharacterized protein (TIGR02001 family)